MNPVCRPVHHMIIAQVGVGSFGISSCQPSLKTGAGTATVTRDLSDKINEDAAPGDRVSGEQLRGRVRDKEGSLKRYNVPNKPEENPIPTNYEDKPEPKPEAKVEDEGNGEQLRKNV